MALLCLTTLAGGVLALRYPPDEPSTAIQVGSFAGSDSASTAGPAPRTPAAAASISLPDLVQELRARATTSTAAPKTTVTTKKPATAITTTTSRAPATTTTSARPGQRWPPPRLPSRRSRL